MGLRPKPRKFFEKNLTKNFHRESFLWIYIVRSPIVLRKKVRSTVERTNYRLHRRAGACSHRKKIEFIPRVVEGADPYKNVLIQMQTGG